MLQSPHAPWELIRWIMFPWCPPRPLTPKVFPYLLPCGSLSSEKRDPTGTFNLDFFSTECLAMGLCTCSLLLLEETYLMMTDKAVTYEYRRISIYLTWSPHHERKLMPYTVWMARNQRLDNPETESRTKHTWKHPNLYWQFLKSFKFILIYFAMDNA